MNEADEGMTDPTVDNALAIACPASAHEPERLTVGSIAGGLLGAKIGRHLPAAALRGVIVAVGIAAIVKLLA